MIAVALLAALLGIGVSLYRTAKQRSNQAMAMQKMKAMGAAFASYTTEKNGLLPFEDAPGTDDWVNAAKPEAAEAWYNALPRLMNSPSVGELALTNPAGLYEQNHPLFIPGAPYPGPDKRLSAPTFALGMNSRLQRKDDAGIKKQGRLEMIQAPSSTVVLLERGMPGDKQVMPAQRGFDGSPKANPRAFAARHNQKGCLIFADGHAELRACSELLTPAGAIIVPQTSIVWTFNPDDDPE
jgi:type II secretory pathway pseudopilin PulG